MIGISPASGSAPTGPRTTSTSAPYAAPVPVLSAKADVSSPRAASRTAHIALFGEFGIGNIGNDASGQALVALMHSSSHDIELTAISPAPAEATHALGIPALPIRSPHQCAGTGIFSKLRNKARDLNNLVSVVSRFDAVVVPGTGLLERVDGRLPGGDLTWMLLLSVACFVKRVPLAWLAIGGSRTLPPLQRLMASLAARVPHYISFRDHETAASIGTRVNDERIVPDIVFTYSAAAPIHSRETEVVGLAVINYRPEHPRARQKYLAELATVARDIMQSGRHVKFLLGDRADAAPSESVRAHASIAGCDFDCAHPYGSFSDLRAAVAECDVVVASRYHVIVASALAATPIVAIAHADKDVALMKQLGLSESILHADTATSEAILDLVDQCSARRSEIRSHLIECTAAFRTDSLREFSRSGIASPRRRNLT